MICAFYYHFLLFCITLAINYPPSTALGASLSEPIDDMVDSATLVRSEHFSMSYYENSLKNKRIIFMGDSLTRYQFIALIYSLSEGRYLQSSLRPNPVEERTYDGWYNFFHSVTAIMKPLYYCDCTRSTHDKVGVVSAVSVENHYWFDQSRNLSIVFIWTTNGEYTQGHWSDSGDLDQFRMPLQSDMHYFWRYNLQDTLNWLENSVFPSWAHGWKSVLIFNVGHWPHNLSNSDAARSMYQIINNSKIDQFIWKTTTFSTRHPRFAISAHDSYMCGFPNVYCFNTSWTHKIQNSTSSYLMWDIFHFTAPVYNRLNFELMPIIK